MRIKGFSIHGNGYRDLQLWWQLLDEVAQLSNCHLVIVGHVLLNLMADVLTEAILDLKLIEYEHFFVQLSTALVPGLEDGGERALESRENEDSTHHHED